MGNESRTSALFVLGQTHMLTTRGLERCADFCKDPPKDGRIEYSILPDGSMVLVSPTSYASAEIPPGEWQEL